MRCVDELIKKGFEFNIIDGKIKYEFTGKSPPRNIEGFFDELKLYKDAAIHYIQRIKIFEVDCDDTLDPKVREIFQQGQDNGIRWLRVCLDMKSKKIKLIGIAGGD